MAEDAAAPLLVNLLTNASDIDTIDTLGVQNLLYSIGAGPASPTVPAGFSLVGSTLTVDPTDAAFQHLGVGDSTVIHIAYTVADTHGGTVAQTAAVTVTGTNDAPRLGFVQGFEFGSAGFRRGTWGARTMARLPFIRARSTASRRRTAASSRS